MVFKTDYARYYDLFNRNKDYGNEIIFLEQVFKKFSKCPVKSILDLGCGTGLHTQELVRRGYEVSGLDLSKEMIEIAKKRNPNASFYVGNMSNFDLVKNGGKFDVIICMFSALGYLTENSQLESFFNCCKNHLKANGLLILDVWNGLGVMHELPSSREKIAEVKDENNLNLKIIRKSFPELDSKNHINNVKFIVKIFEKIDNINNKKYDNDRVIGEVIRCGGSEAKLGESSFSSHNLIDTKIKDDEIYKLITEYEEAHKVRFFFPLEIKKYMEDAGFKSIHLCPSFEIDKELTYEYWNMILVGKMK
ncbi:MAG: class I SAM-dependent methyltransferase [Nanoarchaeota archaeon]